MLDLSEFSDYLKTHSIEELLENVEIDKVDDHVIRLILRTIKFSLERLDEELVELDSIKK
jgi:HEPN domain-containing protein